MWWWWGVCVCVRVISTTFSLLAGSQQLIEREVDFLAHVRLKQPHGPFRYNAANHPPLLPAKLFFIMELKRLG